VYAEDQHPASLTELPFINPRTEVSYVSVHLPGAKRCIESGPGPTTF